MNLINPTMKELTHKQMSSLGGKSSWAKQIQGKTKDEIHEMMAKRARRRKKKNLTKLLSTTAI